MGKNVYLRSDIKAAPNSPASKKTIAHEAVHLLQQGSAIGPRIESGHHDSVEGEAERGASEFLAGKIPIVMHKEASPTLRFELDPATDFDPGTVALPLAEAQANPMWPDQGILNYELSKEEPWVFTILYRDGSLLPIPLSRMSFASIEGPSVTLYRQHISSGRIVPFQIAQADLGQAAPGATSDAMLQMVPPRFDPSLTPLVISYLNQAQALFLAEGFTRVLSIHLMNPALLGWGAGATMSSSSRRLLLRAGLRQGSASVAVDALAVGEEILLQTSKLGGTGLQRYFEFARRLSGTASLSAAQKASLLESFAGRFGIEVGGQVAMDGGRILLVAKDGRSALQILADGTITLGEFNTTTMDVAGTVALRPLGL